jgi:hypothetical protein
VRSENYPSVKHFHGSTARDGGTIPRAGDSEGLFRAMAIDKGESRE